MFNNNNYYYYSNSNFPSYAVQINLLSVLNYGKFADMLKVREILILVT